MEVHLKFRIWPALALALLCAITPAAAQRLDGIAAVVNDDVVLQSDVEEQLYLFLSRVQAQPDSSAVDTLRRQILDQLIDEKLIVAEAKRQGVVVTEAEINKQVDEAVQEAKTRMGSAEAFHAQLQRENLTEEKLREKYRTEVRRQMTAQRLVQKAIQKKTVTATEAEAYFKAHPEKFPKVPAEVRVSVIQIPVSSDSVTDSKARARAVEARKRITGGEKFAKVAAEVSDDPGSAQAGGDLGFFTKGSMEPAFEAAAFSQKINEVGPPVRSSFGWHVIQVLERDTVKTAGRRDSLDQDKKPVLEAHARHLLIRVEVGDNDIERARTLADKVRSEAAKGSDFAALVRRHSKFQGAPNPDGDLGFLSLGTLQPQIRAGLEGLKPGEVSQVLSNRAGFNIFKMVDLKPERDYALEEIRAELPAAVAQIQYKEKYDQWVKGLRAKAHIEIRKS